MQELTDKKIFSLIRICMFVAAVPFFFYIFVGRGFEISVVSGQTVFWAIDCFPLYCLWNLFYKPRKISDINDPRFSGFTTALKGFVIIHLVFYITVWSAIKGGGQGVSTTGVVFIFLPFVTIAVMVLSYFGGYFFRKFWK